MMEREFCHTEEVSVLGEAAPILDQGLSVVMGATATPSGLV